MDVEDGARLRHVPPFGRVVAAPEIAPHGMWYASEIGPRVERLAETRRFRRLIELQRPAVMTLGLAIASAVAIVAWRVRTTGPRWH